MRIAIISRSDRNAGGASRVAADLAEGLERRGHEVDHWVSYLMAPALPRHRNLSHGLLRWFVNSCTRRVSRVLGLQDLLTPHYFLFRRGSRRPYDIVHFHDNPETFSPLSVRWVAKRYPTIWTFHDCSAFTGGCLYPGDCPALQRGCGACPQLHDWPICSPYVDLTHLMWSLNRRVHVSHTVLPTVPTRWMAAQAMKSGMFDQEPVLLRYGIDTHIFRPIDRALARTVLALPQERRIVLFGAAYLNDPRKGVRFALDALRRLPAPRPFLLALGHPPDSKALAAYDDFDIRLTGFLQDPMFLAQHLAAVDVFLFPSLQDNSPLLVLEAMAAGLPTVTFRTGGIPELVTHQRTGYVAEPEDVDGLVRGLQLALDPDTGRRWGMASRRTLEEQFSLGTFLDAHLDIYHRVHDGEFRRGFAAGGGHH